MFNRKGVITQELLDKRISDPDSQKLLESLPVEMAEATKKAFVEYVFDGEIIKKMQNYYPKNSIISADIMENPGSPETFHYLYLSEDEARRDLTNPIDWFFWNCKSGTQIRDRLHVMQNKIPELLEELFPNQEKILIDNLGSGQGYDVIGAMKNNRELAARSHVRNIDIDERSLKRGWAKIVKYDLQGTFENVLGDMKEIKKRKADLLVISGIFCPTALKEARLYMRFFKRFVKKGGYILYNATTLKMFEGDPLCDFLMFLGGWQMDYKSVEDILSIARKAKLEIMETFFDSRNYNCCVIAKK